MAPQVIDIAENRRRMLAGELYYAFTPDLIVDRAACRNAVRKYIAIPPDAPRRAVVEAWNM